jgi:hypothetical protein
LNIYSALTIYFYLDAIPGVGQAPWQRKNSPWSKKCSRTNGLKQRRKALSRPFPAGAHSDPRKKEKIKALDFAPAALESELTVRHAYLFKTPAALQKK